jgi:hypothetical protein
MKRTATARVLFGGEAHEGWLPHGAARPSVTASREVVLEVTLESEGTGYLLSWVPQAGESVQVCPPFSGDLWYETLESACEAARDQFGVRW